MNKAHLETRRIEAAHLLATGCRQSQVAARFEVSRTTVSRWQRRLNKGGMESLRGRKSSGRPSFLTGEQRGQLADLYRAGPQAAGLGTGGWTGAWFAEAIGRRFGVFYNEDHVRRLMDRMGLRERKKQRAMGAAVGAEVAA